MTVSLELPSSAGEAAELLSSGGLAIAGGTHVMPQLNTRAHEVGRLVSLRHAGLAGVEMAGPVAELGAATTLAQVGRDERLAVLRPVVESIASPTVRNLATVGGNLFVPAPYGDLTVALLALDAEIEVVGTNHQGRTAVAAALDGQLPSGSVVTRVRFTVPQEDEFFYTKAMRRRLNSASIVTVAAVVRQSDGIVHSAAIALGGAAPRPMRCAEAEAALVGGLLNLERVEAAAQAAVAASDPPTDAYASAWYRRRVLLVHIRRALLGN